jgi:hypothetical protein
MDIERELLKSHAKLQANKVADYVRDNANHFNVLISIFLAGPYRLTQRAAWPISICVDRHPQLLAPHLKRVVSMLNKPDLPDAVKRNVVRMLQVVPIPKSLHGKITEICFRYLLNKKEAIAIRVFAMTVLSRIVKEHDELKRELLLVVEDQLPYASPGFQSRARKVVKQLRT